MRPDPNTAAVQRPSTPTDLPSAQRPAAVTTVRGRGRRVTANDLVVDELDDHSTALPAVLGTAGHQLVAAHTHRDSMAFYLGDAVVYATPDEVEAWTLRVLASARRAKRTPAGTWRTGSR